MMPRALSKLSSRSSFSVAVSLAWRNWSVCLLPVDKKTRHIPYLSWKCQILFKWDLSLQNWSIMMQSKSLLLMLMQLPWCIKNWLRYIQYSENLMFSKRLLLYPPPSSSVIAVSYLYTRIRDRKFSIYLALFIWQNSLIHEDPFLFGGNRIMRSDDIWAMD